MSFALLLLTILIAIVYIGHNVLNRRAGYLTVPFLCAAIITAWFLPQALIVIDQDSVPAQGLTAMMSMAFGSLLCIGLGWRAARRRYRSAYRTDRSAHKRPLMRSITKIRYSRLLIATGAFVGTASVIQIAIFWQPTEALLAPQPSGLITILRMLAGLNPVALLLASVLFLVKRNAITGTLLAIALANFALAVLVSFKRNEILEMFLVLTFSLWAVRGFSIPRVMLPLLASLGLLVLLGAGTIRQLSGFEQDLAGGVEADLISFDDLKSIDWVETLNEGLTSQAAEVKNGIYMLDYAILNEVPTFGMRFWNEFVHRWIPGQFIGSENKQQLQFDLAGVDSALAVWGFEWQLGTTSTGFTEVYLDFSFLGIFVFFLMAYHARKIFDQSLAGDLSAAAIYPSLAILCMISITHGGYGYFLSLPLLLASKFAIQFITQQAKPVAIRRRTPNIQALPTHARSYS